MKHGKSLTPSSAKHAEEGVAMPVNERDADPISEIGNAIKKAESLLASGRADEMFAASAAKAEEAIQKLRAAETIDPQVLRLTVTI